MREDGITEVVVGMRMGSGEHLFPADDSVWGHTSNILHFGY